jgi:hypothetical protein
MTRKIWFSAACLILSAAPALAQEAVLLELYGKGVHAYFAGRTGEAMRRFNTAISAGSTDPRVYYFRGLTSLQYGDQGSAQRDFAKAGELEVADSDEFYDVSRSLERIQGPVRLEIEEYRLAARVNALERSRQLQYERYERIRRAEPNVTIPPEVEEPAPPVEEPAPPVEEPVTEPAEAPAEEPAAPSDPFSEPTEEAAPEPATEEPAMEEPAAEEPVMEEEAPADAPVEEMPAEEPPADATFEEPAPDVPSTEEPALDTPVDEPPADAPADAPADEPPAGSQGAFRGRSVDRIAAHQIANAGWRLWLLHPPLGLQHGWTAGGKARSSRY